MTTSTVFTASVRRGEPYLAVRASGFARLADLLGLADLAARVALVEGHARVLIDLREVRHGLSFTDHLTLGSHVAQASAHLERVATVVPPALRTGNSERAAQKLGANLRTFTDVEEAVGWLGGA